MVDSKKKLVIARVAFIFGILIVVFLSIYFLSTPRQGALPVMPEVSINDSQIDFAVRRFRERAGSVELESYHNELTAVFKKLNLAEAENSDNDTIAHIQALFLEKTLISQTAQKERYLLTGDYLALAFENTLNRVLGEIRQKGLARAMGDGSAAYRELVALSGNFLKKSIENGMIRQDGQQQVPSYLPEILFRKRWRILGELPHLYQFLEIESMADAAYTLKYGNPVDVDRRLRAVRRIQQSIPGFDYRLATALIYFEGGETERAKAVVTAALKDDPDNFTMNEFLLFLSSDTKR
ncbi:MAG: hypothetical protein JXR76_19205 [Deltaproteobacteria bacterium]|nr:hypothetical protein [Deltaproteobacteria bacterium]